jgi:hypothetical protein
MGTEVGTVTVNRPCYVTREQVCRAADINFSARIYDAVDRAIESASENIDQFTNRRFYTATETNKWDYPNYQLTYPYRLWLDNKELAGQPTLVVTGASGTPVTIPSANYVLWPYTGPPFTRLELRLDKTSAFGASPTPQQDIAITGPVGYWDRRKSAGALAIAFSDTVGTSAQITNGNLVGVGDVLIVDSERMLVQDKRMISTGVTWTTGVTTDVASDNLMVVPDSTVFAIGEVVRVDDERMLIADITGNTLVVKRAFDGTLLSDHSFGLVYANRLLTVTRGDLGSTAATHLIGAVPTTQLIPAPVRDLALAEAVVQTIDEVGAYASTHGGDGGGTGYGGSLPDRWEEVGTGFGRQARIRAI